MEWHIESGNAKEVIGINEDIIVEIMQVGNIPQLSLTWKVEYKDGEQWKVVEVKGDYTVTKDAWDIVQIKPIETDALRMVIDLPEEYATGLYEVIIE